MVLPHKAITAVVILLALLTGCLETEPTDTPISPTPTLAIPVVESPQPPNKLALPTVKVTPTSLLGDTWIRPSDGMTMINVSSGTFRMGSTQAEIEDAIILCKQHYSNCNRWYYQRESPQHMVFLDGFWLDQTEVTNTQFRQCVEDGECSEPLACKKGEPTYDDPSKSDHPVVCVSWDEAQAYCEWTGGRLPTEAEWEYAFRGENGFIYPWGNAFDGTKLNYCDANCDIPHADNHYDDGYQKTAPSKSFPQDVSWGGALGMSGNVSEWVADWFGKFSPESFSNPVGPTSGSQKMVKGCSWFFHPAYCRGAARASVDPDTRYDYLGFRCVISTESAFSESVPPTESPSPPIAESTIPVTKRNPPTIDGTLLSGE